MLHKEFVRLDESDSTPRFLVEKTVGLAGGDLEIDVRHTHFFPFRLGDVPPLLPFILVTKEDDGRRDFGLQVIEDLDLWILVVIQSEGRVEPQVGDDTGVDVLRVGRIVEAGVQSGERTDVSSGAAAAGNDSGRVDAEFASVLLEPANRALGVSDANTFLRLTVRAFGGGFAEHLIFRRGTDETATGEVGAGDAELGQSAAGPPAAVEEDHAQDFSLRGVVVWREENLHLPLFAGRGFVDVRLAGWAVEFALGGCFSGE